MSKVIGILIGLLLSFIVIGIVIIKNDGYFIARNPFFGPEKTEKEQKIGYFMACRMIWISSILLVLILLILVKDYFL